MEMRFDTHLFRCSQLGKLMVKSRSKTEQISKTTQSYLDEIFKVEYFGKYIEIKSKYLEKGKIMEDEAIRMIGRLDDEIYWKNTTRFNNEFITGEPDVIADDIKDIKCSWSYATFPLLDTEIKNKDYWWQLQGYMWLTGKTEAELCYCLLDTPEELFKLPEDELKYTTIPEYKRVKRFTIKYDEKAIEELKKKIVLCREYLDTLHKKL